MAAVAMTERGHSALTAMPAPRNSSAIPSTHMLIPYFAIVYATWSRNHFGIEIQRRRQRQDVRIAPRRGRRFEMRQARLRAQERAAHVDAEHQVEALHRRRQRAGQADGARVVDQDVDAAERARRSRRPPRAPRPRRGCRRRSAAPCRPPPRSPRRRYGSFPAAWGCGSVVFAAIATLAPSRAARSAMASPMPREPPVTKSVLPCEPCGIARRSALAKRARALLEERRDAFGEIGGRRALRRS